MTDVQTRPDAETTVAKPACQGAGSSRRVVLAGASALGVGCLLAACGTDTGGAGSNGAYVDSLTERISANGLAERVTLERDWIPDERKVELFASALGVAYLPFDEDSYGYPTLEAFHSRRPVVTTSDSGGVLEIVEHERTGLVAEPSAASLANAFDRLYADRALAARLGAAGAEAIVERNISWAHTIERLLA